MEPHTNNSDSDSDSDSDDDVHLDYQNQRKPVFKGKDDFETAEDYQNYLKEVSDALKNTNVSRLEQPKCTTRRRKGRRNGAS